MSEASKERVRYTIVKASSKQEEAMSNIYGLTNQGIPSRTPLTASVSSSSQKDERVLRTENCYDVVCQKD